MEDDGGLLILLFSYHFFSSLFFTHICCGVFFLPTLFCRLSVVWIDSCTGSTIKPIKPDNFQTTFGSIVYLLLYCSIVKFRAVFSQVNWWVTGLINVFNYSCWGAYR